MEFSEEKEGPFSAGAYYSRDFEWEALRQEVESSPWFLSLDRNQKPASVSGSLDLKGQKNFQTQQVQIAELDTLELGKRSLELGKGIGVPQRPRSSRLMSVSKLMSTGASATAGSSSSSQCSSSSALSSESRAWQAFHTRHSKKLFFKERRYLVKEFPELLQGASCILEIGCGTGSSVVSILRANPRVTMFACDCSEAALTKASEIVSSLSAESRTQFYPFLCDVTHELFPFWLLCSSCKTTGFQSDDKRASKARVGRGGGEVRISLELGMEKSSPQLDFCSGIGMEAREKLGFFPSGLCSELSSFGGSFKSRLDPKTLENPTICIEDTQHSKQGALECGIRGEMASSSNDNNNGLLPSFSASRCEEKPPLITHCCVGGVDIVMLIFTLSAIPVASMPHVLAKVLAVLKPGGYLLFRDYGLYDMTMLRFAPSQRISHEAGVPLYQRDDGTLCYYFSVKNLRELLTTTGFVEEELEYCCVKLINQRKQMPMKRVWVHAKFRKPFATI